MENEIIQAIKEDRLYDFIANHYWEIKPEMLKDLICRLNGTKILLRGNHDFKRGVDSWKEVGFSEVYKKRIELENLILTHAPIEIVEEGKINVFGHIHDKPLDKRFNKNNHICVSCDVVDYKPIAIDTNK